MNFSRLMVFILVLGLASCSSKKNEQVAEENLTGMSQAVAGKILVTLLEGESTKALEVDFDKYDLKHKSIASKSQNQHLFTFDKNKISSEDLLKKLNRNKTVYLAEPLSQQLEKPQKFTSGKRQTAPVK